MARSGHPARQRTTLELQILIIPARQNEEERAIAAAYRSAGKEKPQRKSRMILPELQSGEQVA